MYIRLKGVNFAKLITNYGYSMITEKEKMLRGELYDANNDPSLIDERRECKILLHAFNAIIPANEEAREELRLM